MGLPCVFRKRAFERRFIIHYINAEDVLPAELLEQLRQYVEGEAIYIPRSAGTERRKWGGSSGARAELDRRNEAIRSEAAHGANAEELGRKYCLSPDSIRKIVRKK